MKTILQILVCQVMIFGFGVPEYRSLAQVPAETTFHGYVVTGGKTPIPGVIIKVMGTGNGAVTDSEGYFSLSLPSGEYQLELSLMGFESRQLVVALPLEDPLVIEMEENGLAMDEVEVVSTGYQELSKERATGSFVHIDEELVNRRVSTNILERLEDVTPGLIFNRAGTSTDRLSIRGRSTLFANAEPLIVIDNFPYDGPIESINPNDVESISVLRDAAAASIWGARAGNGVIVITTKKGREGKGPQVTINSNVTVVEKPDLYYVPRMGMADHIGVEEMLFERGYYRSMEISPNRTALSPVVETLIAERDGVISAGERASRISQYQSQDLRRDLENHYYRPAVNQQYALNIRGGTGNHRYSYGVGYDNNRNSIRGNENGRLTLNAQNSWSLLGDRMDASVGIYYAQHQNHVGTALPNAYPYERLADASGNPLPIIQGYSQRYINEGLQDGLVDWRFIPLEEIGRLDDRSMQHDFRINSTLGYNIAKGLKAEVLYQYWTNQSKNRNHQRPENYFTRTLINQYSQINPDGSVNRIIPNAGILDLGMGNSQSHSLRGQLNYTKDWNGNQLVALGGYELKDLQTETNQSRFYGYDDGLGISIPMDLVSLYPVLPNPGLRRAVPSGIGHTGLVDRFLSYYGNASYTYQNRYTLSASARKDQSNLFGVDANMRGVPLWSVGGSWNISNEQYYKLQWVPYLRMRMTYGYNGNIDKSRSAYTTATFVTWNSLIPNLPFAEVTNPPNPELRWERINITNLALDFESRNGILSGSLEVYRKNGQDLLGERPFPAASGVNSFRGNFANTQTNGLDFSLNTINLETGNIRWSSNLFYSHLADRVILYEVESTVSAYLNSSSGGVVPLEGNPLMSLYSYQWGGLNPDTGNPLGYLNGELSDDYLNIIRNTTPESMVFHGSLRPTSFGSIRNNIDWKGFSFSFNISYRLGFYYRRESVNYANVLTGRIDHADYGLRWQNPGDENSTQVPSMPELNNNNRNNFYRFSSALVEKGDHVRLQDVRLSYNFNKERMPRLPFKNAEIYTYANNLGILWKASDDPLDPDFRTMRPLRSIAAGIRIDF